MLPVTDQVSRLGNKNPYPYTSSVREAVDKVIDTENDAYRRLHRESNRLEIVESCNERSKRERVHKVYSLLRHEF